LLGLQLAIGLGVGLGIGVGLGLGIGIVDLNQIADLKLSILVPVQITDLNLTPCFNKYFFSFLAAGFCPKNLAFA